MLFCQELASCHIRRVESSTTAAIKQITNILKFSKIDAENVGSILQNDSSTAIKDSSNNALAKSEIEVTRFSACSGYVRIWMLVWHRWSSA